MSGKRISETKTRANGAGSFFSFFVLGSGYIIAAKIFDLPPAIVTFIPVAIMILYAVVTKYSPGLRLRDDQTGDNCYYLGFLYTLTSLGMSLYQFDAAGTGEDIIQNFGVAVGSTIAGVALRVLFHQMRQDPEDVEGAARLELAEASRRVRRELDASVRDFASFRRATQQQISEGFIEVHHSLETVTKRLPVTFDELAKNASRPIEEVSENSSSALASLAKTINESLKEAALSLASENQKLAVSTGEISTALQSTACQITAMQTPDKIIEVQLQPIANELSLAVREFGTRLDARAASEDGILKALLDSNNNNESQQEKQRETAETMWSAAKIIQDNTERERDTSETLAEISDVLQNVALQTRTGAEQTDSGTNSMENSQQGGSPIPALESLQRSIDALTISVGEFSAAQKDVAG